MKFRTISLSIASLFACTALATAHCGKCDHKDKEKEKEGEGEKKEEAQLIVFAEEAKDDEKKDDAKDEEKKEEAKLIADGDCKGGKCNDKKDAEEAEAPALV
jgi:hypothetical protein